MEPPSHVTNFESSAAPANERAPGRKTSREEAFGDETQKGQEVKVARRALTRERAKFFKFVVLFGGIQITPQQPPTPTALQETHRQPFQGAGGCGAVAGIIIFFSKDNLRQCTKIESNLP